MRVSATPRQLALLRFVTGYQEAHGGVSPTFVEMMRGIGSASRGGIFELLTQLEARGFLRRLPARERAIEVLAAPPLPRAPDGAPLYAATIGKPAMPPTNRILAHACVHCDARPQTFDARHCDFRDCPLLETAHVR